jgi:hypothetical protein
MLAENGNNTLTVNAVFVSGDAVAASDLEIMLKSVYMEPPRPVLTSSDAASQGEISVLPASADVRTGSEAVQPAPKSQDVLTTNRVISISQDIRSADNTPPRQEDLTEPDRAVSADLIRPVSADEDIKRNDAAASNDSLVSPDIGGGDDAVSSDESGRKTKVRIITENGVVSVEDVPTETPGGENGPVE